MCQSYYSTEKNDESSQIFFKIDVHKNFVIFTGKHLIWRLFLTKLQAFMAATLLKWDSNTGENTYLEEHPKTRSEQSFHSKE